MSFKPPCPVSLEKVSIFVEDLESYTGIRYLGLGLAQHEKPYPEIQHELGGARVYFTTKERWENFVKPKYATRMGQRPVPEQLLRDSETPKAPEKIDV